MSYVILVEHEGVSQVFKASLNSNKTVTVGRGWNNDVVVSDGFVDASHLSFSVDEDGHVMVSDLSTKNGSIYKKTQISADQDYVFGEKITIGESIVSLAKADAEVPPAMKWDLVQKASRYFNSWLWVIVATVVAGMSLYGWGYWATSEETTSDSLTKLFGYTLLGMLGWCVAAGYLDNIFKKKMFIKLHWIFSSFVIFLSLALIVLTEIVRLNINSETLYTNMGLALCAVLIAFAVYGVLTISTRSKRVNKLTIAGVIAVMPIVVFQFSTAFMEEHEYWTNDAHVILVSPPPALMFRTPVSVEDHLEKTDELFAYLDSVTGFDEDYEEPYDSTPIDYSSPVIISESTNEGM